MKRFITNVDNLKDSDITEVVKRVKVLLINSKNEILLGYSHNMYQFPGGHVEKGEPLTNTVNREVLEETGIELDLKNIRPFACAIGYYKDWPEKNKNRETKIYYYEIITDKLYDLNNTKYTNHEKEGNFELRYISLSNVEEEIQKNVNMYGDKYGIANEMIQLLNYYKNMNN